MTKITEANQNEIEITWIVDMPSMSKTKGDITTLEAKYAKKYIECAFARLTTEEDRVVPPPVEYTEVIFFRAHPRYAYSKGNIGKIPTKDVEDLENSGYVTVI